MLVPGPRKPAPGTLPVPLYYKDRSNSGQSRFCAESAPPEHQASRSQPPAPHQASWRAARHPRGHRQRRPQERHGRPAADHLDGRQDGLQGPDPPKYGWSLQVPPRGTRCQAHRSRLTDRRLRRDRVPPPAARAARACLRRSFSCRDPSERPLRLPGALSVHRSSPASPERSRPAVRES